jgi:hypothetical protein
VILHKNRHFPRVENVELCLMPQSQISVVVVLPDVGNVWIYFTSERGRYTDRRIWRRFRFSYWKVERCRAHTVIYSSHLLFWEAKKKKHVVEKKALSKARFDLRRIKWLQSLYYLFQSTVCSVHNSSFIILRCTSIAGQRPWSKQRHRC